MCYNFIVNCIVNLFKSDFYIVVLFSLQSWLYTFAVHNHYLCIGMITCLLLPKAVHFLFCFFSAFFRYNVILMLYPHPCNKAKLSRYQVVWNIITFVSSLMFLHTVDESDSYLLRIKRFISLFCFKNHSYWLKNLHFDPEYPHYIMFTYSNKTQDIVYS